MPGLTYQTHTYTHLVNKNLELENNIAFFPLVVLLYVLKYILFIFDDFMTQIQMAAFATTQNRSQ